MGGLGLRRCEEHALGAYAASFFKARSYLDEKWEVPGLISMTTTLATLVITGNRCGEVGQTYGDEQLEEQKASSATPETTRQRLVVCCALLR